jgi:hypothetical protein
MFARVASTLSREDVDPLAEKRNGKPIEGTWMTVLLAVMKDKPWEEVKVIIDGLRPGLVALRWEWGIHFEVPAGTVSYSYQRNPVFR